MTELLETFSNGVALDLMTIAKLHDCELADETRGALQRDCFPDGMAFKLASEPAVSAIEILRPAVKGLGGDGQTVDELAADFAAIYLNHGYAASPCESVWIDEEGLAMQQPMFQVREFYARHGLSAQDWRKRTDDHLVHQLQFLGTVLERGEFAEAARFLDEHTLRWIPDFALRVSARADTPFYAGLALLTAAYLEELRDVLAQILEQPRPSPDEIERRMKPKRETVLPMPSSYVPGSAPSW
ncbi:MAG: molecular chaperone TorD family protein [Sedimenticolaceae bacterium]